MNKPANQMMTTDAQQPEGTQAKVTGFTPGSTMDQIGQVMEPNAYGILVALVTWAKLWDQCYTSGSPKGENVMTWDDSTMKALLSPFVGFGNNLRAWGIVSSKVQALVGREVPLWLGDPAYRKSHTMVWCVIQSIAPTLASDTFGLDGQQAVVKIIAAGFTDG